LQIEALPLPPLMMASQAGEDVNRGPGEKAARRFRGYARERREASVQVEKPVFEEALLLPGGWIGPAMR
jgi:hypothetical protein